MHIDFGTRRIEYDVRFDPKPFFQVAVDLDGSVHVVAPTGKSLEAIAERVRRKAPWIIRQINYFERLCPNSPGHSYVAGATHYYLGRQHRLKVIAFLGKPHVCLKDQFFYVSLADPSDTRKIEILLHQWYRERAKILFRDILDKGMQKIRRHGIAHTPTLVVRSMKRRWGSCTKYGKILLNLELIKVPSDCIEYVVMHELCHLVERNHTDKFYHLLSSLMPNWRKIKEKIERGKPGVKKNE